MFDEIKWQISKIVGRNFLLVPVNNFLSAHGKIICDSLWSLKLLLEISTVNCGFCQSLTLFYEILNIQGKNLGIFLVE